MMSRRRKNDPTTLLRPILEDLAREIARAVEGATEKQVRSSVESALTALAQQPARGTRVRHCSICGAPGHYARTCKSPS